ncbi:MAG: peptidoglycan-associated lipoprotein Pal [Candidatus Eisenbacteria bacterium]
MGRRKTVLLLVLCLVLVPLLASCGGKKEVPPPAPTKKEPPKETVKPVPVEPAEVEPKKEYEFADINFDFDRYELKPVAQKILAQHAKVLSENPAWKVRIEGHCDERGTVEYNLGLGEKRANAAKAYLVQYGVAGANVTTVTYGKERPKDPGHNEAAWAINRRAEFRVTK